MTPEVASGSGTPDGTDSAPRMRVLVCTPKYAPQVGGAETWLRALLDAMGERGHEISVLARAARDARTDHRSGAADVHRVPGGRVAFSRAIHRAVSERKPDVVLAHYSALPLAVWAARRAGVPVVGIVHDVYGWWESRRIKGMLVGTLRYLGLERSLRWLTPDAFLANSEATARRLRPLARGREITVVPAGADHLRASGRGPGAHVIDVVYVGRLVKQKGAGDLVEAISLLRRSGSPVRAVVVGTGPEESSLRARAATLGDSVTLAGRLSDEDLDVAIRDASLLALPSTREGWGLAVTEAAARGVPYVAYDIPAVREQHELLRGGVLVEPNARALAGAIRTLLDDPAERKRLGETGRRNATTLRWSDAAAVAEGALMAVVQRNPSTVPRGSH